MFNAIFKWLVSYILDSSIYLNGTVTNMKASATLVTVHISTNPSYHIYFSSFVNLLIL